MRQVSKKRAKAARAKSDVREAVFARDGRRCRLLGLIPHACSFELTPHHLRKQSAGGEYRMANLITLCPAANTLVEDQPVRAHGLGLVVRNGESLEDAWRRMHLAGVVSYGPTGEPFSVGGDAA